MAKITTRFNSLTFSGEYVNTFRSIGRVYGSLVISQEATAGTVNSNNSYNASTRTSTGTRTLVGSSEDCPLNFFIDEVECFSSDAQYIGETIANFVSERNPKWLNSQRYSLHDELGDDTTFADALTSFAQLQTDTTVKINDAADQGNSLIPKAFRGGGKPYANYILARIRYTSPCQINGAHLELQFPEAEIITFFGSIKDSGGVQRTGEADSNLFSLFKSEEPAITQGVVFSPTRFGKRIPSASTPATLCWVLLGQGVPEGNSGSSLYGTSGGSEIICPEEIPIKIWSVVKPEWKTGNLNLATNPEIENWVDFFGDRTNSWNAANWALTIAGFCGGSYQIISTPYVGVIEYYSRAYDVSGDGNVTLTDFIAFINWLQDITYNGAPPGDVDFNIEYPSECCEDLTTELPPEVPEENVDPVRCDASLEILDVKCVSSGDSDTSVFGNNYSEQMHINSQSYGAGGQAGKYAMNVSSVRAENCNDDDVNSDSTDMYILVGLKSDKPISGFQFDVGFNRLSNAPERSIEGVVATDSALDYKNWNLVHQTFSDRFGYDKVVRVISWQPLIDFSKESTNLGFNIQDEEFFRGLNTFSSLDPSPNECRGVAVIQVKTNDATAAGTCPCPKKVWRIGGGGLDNIQANDRNRDQQRNPNNYTQDKAWYGPKVYSEGQWWTCETSGGQLHRKKDSVPLYTTWDGIDIMNMRVVTNVQPHKPQHSQYDLVYTGEFLGMNAVIPNEYESYISFFTSGEGIAPWVLKALFNGMNASYLAAESDYNFLWDKLFSRQVSWLEDKLGSTLNDTQRQDLLNDINKGFGSDANLDGKFDVADLVAIHNSAQLRMLFPETAHPGSDWRKPPTVWAYAGTTVTSSAFSSLIGENSGKATGDDQYGQSTTYNFTIGGQTPSTNITEKNQLPNLEKIVPSYCLNTFNSATIPDHCPAISGGTYAETDSTLKSDIDTGSQTCNGKTHLQYMTQRVDILPVKNATANFVFQKKPEVNATLEIIDVSGTVERIRFSASNTGTELDGGYKAIKIGANLNATMTEVNTFFSSHTDTNITCVLTPSSGNKTGFVLTQGGPGAKGNTLIKSDSSLNLLQYQSAFKNGSTATTNLPPQYRSWSEYFYSRHKIEFLNLYQDEGEYGTSGASFFEIRSVLNLEGRNKGMVPELGFISKAISTLNFCGGYDASTAVKAKILPGAGFQMCDVYDAETGALLTAITTALHNNFYSIPTHGKIKIVSHNFLSAGAHKSQSRASTGNSKYFTPVTEDGGSLVVARVFVTPKPDYSAGKYIELKCGVNSVLATSNIEIVGGGMEPIGRLIPSLGSGKSAVGPRSSQFSQNYRDDSSSLHTYSDYMLHARIIGPKQIAVEYNTMKPFKYATFTIRTHTGTEIEKVILPQNGSQGEGAPWGWGTSHTFHQDKTDAYGFPLEPGQYSKDGYSRVNVYITGSYTDESGVVQTGFSNPPEYNGMGRLCNIFFKEPLYEGAAPTGLANNQGITSLVCPPIGGNNNNVISIPIKQNISDVDSTLVGIEKDYPEGTWEDKKYNADSKEGNALIANFDAEQSYASQVKIVVDGGVNKVSDWASIPGVLSNPHSGTNAHRPTFNINTNDTRKSILFSGGNGLSTATTGTGVRSHDIHKWSAYAFIDMTATLDSSMNHSSSDEAVIFSAGGTASSQLKLVLSLVKTSATQFKLRASSSVSGGSPTNLDYLITVDGSANPKSPLHGWHIISWVGDAEAGTNTLFVDGTEVATGAISHSTTLGEHPVVWYIGHDGTQGTINGTIGNPTGGKPFGGRVGQIMLFKEAHQGDNKEYREKLEAYLAVKNPNEGTASIQNNFKEGHIAHVRNTAGQVTEQISVYGLKQLNTTDVNNEDKLLNREDLKSQPSRSSTRCKAQWVSDHVCLDKSAQTLLNVSCEGTGDGFFLGE